MTEHVRMAEQLAFHIIPAGTKRVRIPGVWVDHPTRGRIPCTRQAPTGFECVCGHGLWGPETKRCCYCGARRVKR